MSETLNNFDLEERTEKFGDDIVVFCKSLKLDPISKNLVGQLVRSGTSIGANYMEANGASSKKDFKNKIHICKKEAQETQHWLRMLSVAYPERKDELRVIWKECKEFILIFGKIISTLRNS